MSWWLIPAILGAAAALLSKDNDDNTSKNDSDFYSKHDDGFYSSYNKNYDEYYRNGMKSDWWKEYDDRSDYDYHDILHNFRETQVRETKPDEKMEAGDNAEKELQEYITHHENFLGCECWLNKRLKDKIGGGEGKEIDIIVITSSKIYFFESKNYSGYIIKNPNTFDEKHKWIRIKSSYENGNLSTSNTSTLPEENLADILREKVIFFTQKLSDNGIVINNDKIIYKLIFMNRNLSIEPSILSDTDILMRNSLEKFLSQEQDNIPEEKRIIIALIRYCLKQEGNLETNATLHAISDRYKDKNILTMNEKLISYINSLPSWDHVVLFGGKKIRGDVLKIKKIFKSLDNLDFLNDKCVIKVESPRNENDLLEKYEKSQNIISLKIYDINNQLIDTREGNFFKESKLKIHPAGSSKTEFISIYQIEEIHLRGLYKISLESIEV